MQEPEPTPPPDRAEPTGVWHGSDGSTPSSTGSADPGSPTVLSGSSANRRRLLGSVVTSTLPEPGERIDSFELVEAIGVGGMGAVFRAHDTRLERYVALKILPPEQARDFEIVQRFYQEGRAAARLDHENIARVYTIGNDDRYHYIAFEYIEGITIRQRVERSGPLPIGETINYTLQIAGALVHAAERVVVHRDIKPSNIIITPHGRAKLVDMGLARRFERGADDGLTQSGMTLGTFDYISPEQARDPRDVDVRSDLYSLGCTLYHMLTGRPPFPEGTVLQKLLQHQENQPTDVRELNPNVPPDLANMLVKLMAKDRDRRYQTPEQLVRDLMTLAGSLGLRSVSPEGLVWMSSSRSLGWERHLVWGLPTLALGLVVAGLIWWGQDPGGRSSTLRAGAEESVKSNRRPGVPSVADLPPVVGPTRAKQAAAPSPIDPIETADPRSREFLVDSTEDLLSVLAGAPARSVVILADPGPYEISIGSETSAERTLIRPDLTIKAGPAVQPEIRLSRNQDDRTDVDAQSVLFDFNGGRVTLDGLTFVLEPGEGDASVSAVRAQDTELVVKRCQFRRRGDRLWWGRLAALEVKGTLTAERPAAVRVDSTHFDGDQVGVLAAGPADIALRDCTSAGADPLVWLDNGRSPSIVPAQLRLQHVSVLAGETPIFRFERTATRVRVDDSIFTSARLGEATLVSADSPADLDWQGRANLYSRIGIFLQAAGSTSARETIRDWSRWEDPLSLAREQESQKTQAQVWDESDPAQAAKREASTPNKAFGLVETVPGLPDVGVRLESKKTLAMANPGTPSRGSDSEPPRQELAIANANNEPPTPTSSPSVAATEPEGDTAQPGMIGDNQGQGQAQRASSRPSTASGMPEMPVLPPMDPPSAPVRSESGSSAPGSTGRVASSESTSGPVMSTSTTEKATRASSDDQVLRKPDQLLEALSQPEGRGGTLVLAADADWVLPTTTFQGEGDWVLKAEVGSKRPRIRFRPTFSDALSPTDRSVLFKVESGHVRLEGIDILLDERNAPQAGRWAAFEVRPGAELNLENSTVTVEPSPVDSAVVVVRADEPSGETADSDASRQEPGEGGDDAKVPLAEVRASRSLIRSVGDFLDLEAGRRLDLDFQDVVVSTGGSLVHAHGHSKGLSSASPDPIRIVLNHVTARTAGGLVLLESAGGEPELPVADVKVRDSILATTSKGDPLFRVDGQDALASLRDRIRWEGHGVAYHQINAYRRDQSAQVGSVPTIYDRSSWVVAIGKKEEDPIHGDVRFAQEWDASRPAWTLRREDARLAKDSPSPQAGANLDTIPPAPPSEP